MAFVRAQQGFHDTKRLKSTELDRSTEIPALVLSPKLKSKWLFCVKLSCTMNRENFKCLKRFRQNSNTKPLLSGQKFWKVGPLEDCQFKFRRKRLPFVELHNNRL